MVLITIMVLLATSDQMLGPVPGPYMYISFNLKNCEADAILLFRFRWEN